MPVAKKYTQYTLPQLWDRVWTLTTIMPKYLHRNFMLKIGGYVNLVCKQGHLLKANGVCCKFSNACFEYNTVENYIPERKRKNVVIRMCEKIWYISLLGIEILKINIFIN